MYKAILFLATCFYSISAAVGAEAHDKASPDLTIVHIGDHHSFLKPIRDLRFTLDDQTYSTEAGGFPRVSAQIKAIRKLYPNALSLHAGDALVGTHYYLLHKGLADAKLMNEICFDAYVIGNHDFDDGETVLHDFLRELNSSPCKTDIVTANVTFTQDEPIKQLVHPYTVKTIQGQRYGIIGITGVEKIVKASNPSAQTSFSDEAKTIEKYIAVLHKQGVERIIVLTHVGYQHDIELANTVKGIDVIVGGDSHSLLANHQANHLDTEGPYPVKVTAHGQQTCIVHAWHSSLLVGELHVRFNDDHTVNTCYGQPHILMGEELKKVISPTEKVVLSRKEQKAVSKVLRNNPEITFVSPDPKSQALIDDITKDITDKEDTVVAQSDVILCIGDVPMHNLSDLCDTKNVMRGSELVNMTAQALLYATNEADIALQNGGAVRFDLTKGKVRLEDIYRISPYANELILFTVTGQDIEMLVNQSIAYAHASNNQRGAYPYSAGLRFKVDMNRTVRGYAYDFEVKIKDEWRALKPDDTYKLVTNAFLADGRDGYEHFKHCKTKYGVSKTNMTDIDALKMYLLKTEHVSHIPEEMWSTQSYVPVKAKKEEQKKQAIDL